MIPSRPPGGFITKLALGSLSTGISILKSPLLRPMAGGLAGGIYGAATTDKFSPTQRFRDVAKGAMAGVAIGMAPTALRLLGPTAARGAVNLGLGMGKAGLSLAAPVAKTGFGLAEFAISNPRLAVGMAAGLAVGGYALFGGGPSGGVEGHAALAQQTGISSTGYDLGMGGTGRQDPQNMFTNSANGLVQGLHRGRHRG